MKHSIAFILLVSLAFLSTSCQYHLGRRQSSSRLYLDEIQNSSSEACLTALLRDDFQTEVSRQPGLVLNASEEGADYSFDLTIVDINTSRLASSELRNSRDRDNDSDGYQAVLHRLKLTVKAVVTKNSREQGQPPETLEYTIIGQGDMPRMPDREMSLQPAMQQATQDVVYHLLQNLDLME